ncbi:aromatic ring-hydroxylating dioxygenase subunit alpha (plasmid) [Variovorax sp. V59]|uniref:Rieske 2Fe-2S domain-containing protein n=1 Tax=unclassified Variovorax TaxID=663243 RepID=UPI0034E8B49E
MAYLRNVWYVAGWSDEVQPGGMLARQICDEPVVLYRDEQGSPHALFDRCPHRFAPLSMGTLCEGGQSIQCGYHGLRFGADGKCKHNPHGDGRIPASAAVKAYPVVERWSLLWIWLGEPGRADAGLIPSYPFLDTEHWHVGKAQMDIDANYVLESDNILDLSHIEFLHPGSLGAGQSGEGKTMVSQEGHTVWSRRFVRNEILPAFLYQATGLPEQAPCDRWLDVRWDAPSYMYLQADMAVSGTPREQSIQTPQVHLFTPASEQKTHYFYALALPKSLGDWAAEAAERNVAGLREPFLREDKPMVEAQQRALAGRAFWDMKPVLLDVDAPAVRARRVLDQLLAAEQAAGA